MPATVSGIIDLVRLKLNHSSLSDLNILGMVNDTQRIFQRRYPLKWQEGLGTIHSVSAATAAPQTFDLPTDNKNLDAVFIIVSGEYQLVRHAPDFLELMQEYSAATATSLPAFWTTWGASGYFFPLLSSAVTVQFAYHTAFIDFPGMTASNAFLAQAPEVLEFGAIAEYYEAIFETDKARVWRVKAVDAMSAVVQQARAADIEPLDPIPTTPGTIRSRNRRSSTRGYTWW